MGNNLQPQGPNDAAANQLGGGSTGRAAAPMGPTDASMVGKAGQRSGAMGGSSVAPPAMSPSGSAPGAPTAGGNAGKLKAAFKGRK